MCLLGTFVFFAGHGTDSDASESASASAFPELTRAVPSAPAMAEAYRRFVQGSELASAGELAAALLQVQRAYDLSADPALLFELGELEDELGHPARSARAFEQYLQQAPVAIPELRRAGALRKLDALTAITARLRLETNVQGAELELELERGVAATSGAGSGFVTQLVLDAGERRISVSKAGYETRTISLALEPGERRSVRVDLDKAAGGRSETSPKKARLASLHATPVDFE